MSGEPKWLTDLIDATAKYGAERLGMPEGDIREAITRDAPCDHRYCHDQDYGLCMGVAAAQMDMLEDAGWSRGEAFLKVVSSW